MQISDLVQDFLWGQRFEKAFGHHRSLSLEERTDAEILALIRGHWSAIENGTHCRRDVTLGEDACTTVYRQGAVALATLRNLVNGIYELERERERTKVDTLKSWFQPQSFSTAWPLLGR